VNLFGTARACKHWHRWRWIALKPVLWIRQTKCRLLGHSHDFNFLSCLLAW